MPPLLEGKPKRWAIDDNDLSLRPHAIRLSTVLYRSSNGPGTMSARQHFQCLSLIVLLCYTTTVSAQKVHVELFAEALCPYCAQFTVEKLKPLFSNGISNIMWLDFIPCEDL